MEALSIPLLAQRISDEATAYEYLEKLRWGDEPVCPHCGTIGGHYFLKPRGEGRKTRQGKISQRRVWKCHDKTCRKQFSVLAGTVMHRSHVPVRTWIFVTYEMIASKNGVSSREIERKYGLTPKSAWFLTQRIREAMKRGPSADRLVGTIVADEAFIGGRSKRRYGTLAKNTGGKVEKRIAPKASVVSLVHRESGEVRSRVVPSVTAENLEPAIASQVDWEQSRLITDEYIGYRELGRDFGLGHDTVYHSGGEYVRGDVTTNPVENYFSQLKRSIDGTFHHVSHQHLHRYLAEFDFRYSTRKLSDAQRMARLIGQVHGRRLTYRDPQA